MIDYAMLLYGVSEYTILTEWSIATLTKKIEHGFNFEILKKGGKIKNENEASYITKEEADEQEALYYGEIKNGG